MADGTKDEPGILRICIGPLSLAIHARQHPDSPDLFDRDWLVAGAELGDEILAAPGAASLEASELSRLRADMLNLARGDVGLVEFFSTEQLFSFKAEQTRPGLFAVAVSCQGSAEHAVAAGSADLETWASEIGVILAAYRPRRASSPLRPGSRAGLIEMNEDNQR